MENMYRVSIELKKRDCQPISARIFLGLVSKYIYINLMFQEIHVSYLVSKYLV